jgi:hypothetical protein
MPRAATSWAGNVVISSPRKIIVPELGRKVPVIRLNAVDFPEPLGPIRPKSSPSAMEKDT